MISHTALLHTNRLSRPRRVKSAQLPPNFGRTERFGFPLFKPRGRLDFYLCPDFLKALSGDVHSKHRTIAVDLSAVSSIDLSACWLLATVHEHLAGQKRRLLLLDAPTPIHEAIARAWQRIQS